MRLFCGPCVIESESHTVALARQIQSIVSKFSCFDLTFKASFDKANRTSIHSYRGPGLIEGLRILERVQEELNLPVTTDIHEPFQAEKAAEVCQVLQIPAFLCRQTDLLLAAGRTGRTVNIKKGQFLSPSDVYYAVEKVRSTGNQDVLVTERGSCFGYGRVVVDFVGVVEMDRVGLPVIFDATHSLYTKPEGVEHRERPRYVSALVRAAVVVGVAGLFLEVHDRPEEALSDGKRVLSLTRLEELLAQAKNVGSVNDGSHG